MKRTLVCLFLLFTGCFLISAQKKKTPPPQPPLSFKEGRLIYLADSLDNRIPDFSYAGYMAGTESIPDVVIKVVIPQIDGDATDIIQAAINYVGSLKPAPNGFRGAVLLSADTYKIQGSIELRNSGVVLRGSGVGESRPKLIASGKDRRTLIHVSGQNDKNLKPEINITDDYVPVNAMSLTIGDNHGLKAGDRVFIYRPSTEEWIKTLGTDHFGGGITSLGWKPGDHDLYWDRTIVSVDGNRITIDAPVTTALDKKYGGGYVIPYQWNGRINKVGIENLALVSEYDETNLKDEDHSWMAVTMESVEDAWVRNIEFKHFAGSAVAVLETTKRITVENCKSLAPVSEIGGQRRYTFFTTGQQCLFQRLYAEGGYHDFSVGFCATGPNAFVQCHSELPYSFSGSVDSWASGVLFDVVNVNGQALSYKNRMQEGQGAGWSAANSVFWQCSASLVENFAPPTAQNWAFGTWSEFSGNGYWNESNNHINPRSLYYQQLKERLGEKYIDRANLLPTETEASSSPPVEVALELTKKAYTPALTLDEWIDSIVVTSKIPTDIDHANLMEDSTSPPVELALELTKKAYLPPLTLCEWIDSIAANCNIPTDAASLKPFEYKSKISETKSYTSSLTLMNGWLVGMDNVVKTGQKHSIRWWNGTVRPTYLKKSATPHLTRFVPGRTGIGLTDNIDSVAEWMKSENILTLDHNYGLWYDRRRDDHERIRRINGEVWPPFYEQPFARSGEGTAYDGLSKYDLTKYNQWYWMRLRQFADEADRNGLVLMHQNYFQHNIIEAGAHWADSPWRPANNVNNTGFPEPVPYAGDKRIFLAEQFYDIDHPVRRELHRKYIRQCLDNFKGNNSVIHLTSEEYTGPLHFVEFWLDVIAEWKKETGENPFIALSATKDVQDAILKDPVRSKIVNIIDIRYWFYREDGSAYEPQGGLSLAPRQHARLEKQGKVSFASVYRAVSEYRAKYPEKAVTYFSNQYPQFAWASFMAGGSLTCLPRIGNSNFLAAASKMKIMQNLNADGQYVLGDPQTGYIVYSENGKVNISSVSGKFDLYWIDTRTGNVTKAKQQIKGTNQISLNSPDKQNVAWLVRK